MALNHTHFTHTKSCTHVFYKQYMSRKYFCRMQRSYSIHFLAIWFLLLLVQVCIKIIYTQGSAISEPCKKPKGTFSPVRYKRLHSITPQCWHKRGPWCLARIFNLARRLRLSSSHLFAAWHGVWGLSLVISTAKAFNSTSWKVVLALKLDLPLGDLVGCVGYDCRVTCLQIGNYSI